jgi:hemerythrin superfamily protein
MNAIALLKQDHRQVAELFEDFDDASDDDRISLAGQICQLLTLHALIEEEIFYPAARAALDDDDADLIDEASVEHASLRHLISRIEDTGDDDGLFPARVVVLGEYVSHHVEEEEDQLFPLLEETHLDLQALGDVLAARKIQLMRELGISADDAVESEDTVRNGNVAA